jgi:phosphoglycerate dehydrogenase-like enzyme
MTSVENRLHVVVAVHDPVWTLPEAQIDRITRAVPDDLIVAVRDEATRREALVDADVLLVTRLSAGECASARHLKWVHTTAVGLGGLLSPALVERDVVVTNSRGVHSESIAEHAIALVLALRRSLDTAVVRQAARDWAQMEWSTRPVRRASATRVLVVGLGAIGSRVAAMAAGLGMRVTGVRRRVGLPAPDGVEVVLPPERLIDGLREADVVVLAVPRTTETKALIGAAELGAMPPSAILVNVARGGLVDHDALAAALRAGRLAGAGLDALPREPLPPDDPLWTTPGVLISPHVAAFDGDYWTPIVDLFLDNLARFRRQDPLVNVVDKRRGY